jgi:hypothetical protein
VVVVLVAVPQEVSAVALVAAVSQAVAPEEVGNW